MHRLTGFTGRQIATLATLIGLLALLLPVGARAATQLVTITDAGSTHDANVDANGSLQVTNGKLPLAVRDTSRVPYQSFAPPNCSGSGNCIEYFPPAGSNWEVLSISVSVIREDLDRAYAKCSDTGLAIGDTFVLVPMEQIDSTPDGPFHNHRTFGGTVSTDYVVPAGHTLRCQFRFQGGSGPEANDEVSASGFLIP
jgi:hypothetical protein